MTALSRDRPALLAAAALAPLATLALIAPKIAPPMLASLALAYSAVIVAVALAARGAVLASLGASARRAVPAIAVGTALGALSFFFALGSRGGSARDVLGGLGSTAAILLTATTVGAVVGSRVPHRGHLLPVALVSTAVDLWSALAPEGPTRALATAPDPAWLRILAASAPIAPSRAMEPMLGFADVIFAALYLSAARRHSLSLARTTIAVSLGLAAAGVVAVLLRKPLPALPFIGLFVVFLVRESRDVAREDRGAVAFAAALVLAACARLLWLYAGR
jgi:hypothetical protein